MAENTPSALTRRSFLKATALTAGAAATVGMAGCSTVAEQPEEVVEQATEEQTFINWCRGNCGGPCNLTGVVREGKLVKTAPTVVPKGAELLQRGCVKGHANPQRIYATDRILYPMKQTGERGSDNWERITWDEACALIAEKFKTAEAEYGPEAIGMIFGSGLSTGVINGGMSYSIKYPYLNSVSMDRFMKKTGYSNMLFSGDAAALWMVSYQLMQPMSSIEDIKHSKTVFIWGTNLTDSGSNAWPYVCNAREQGVKVVCIDPQYTKTAAGSDVWVPIRTGTDAALMLAMCNWIVDNDLIDYDYFRNKSVAPLLVKEDGSYLRLSDLGMDLVDVPDATGKAVPTDTEVVYDEATGTFGSSREVVDPAITGEFDAEGIKVRPIWDAVRENIKPFTVEYAAEECGLSVELIEEICELYAKEKPAKILTWCGHEHYENSWRTYFAFGLLASLSGNGCVPGGGYAYGYTNASTLFKNPARNMDVCNIEDAKVSKGFTLEYLPQVQRTGEWAGDEFTMTCAFVIGANVFGSYMGPTYLKEAFSKLDFIVVADPKMTSTAQYADLVLPISLSWEDNDFVWHGPAFMAQKAVEPLGECKNNFEMLKEVAAALGYSDLYPKTQEEYLREILDTPENIEAGMGYDAFKENGFLYDEYKEAELVGQETNPTGRTQFYLEYLEPRDDYGQVFEFTDRMPNYVHAFEAYRDNPLREKYPLFGLSYHNIYFAQSFSSHIPWLDELRGYEGEPFTRIHAKAAAERGIETGDTIRVYNDHGYVVTKAVVTTGIREDTVLVPRGYDTDQYIEGHPQNLIPMAVDPATSNNNLNDWLCQVEKL